MNHAFGVTSKKCLPNTWPQGLSMFSSGSFTTFGFTSKSMTHYK